MSKQGSTDNSLKAIETTGPSLKRKSSDEPLLPVVAPTSLLEPKSKKIKINSGGASKLQWVKILATHEDLADCRQNLFRKIQDTKDNKGCLEVEKFSESTRPVMDKKLLEKFKRYAVDAPERFSPYVIALVQAGKVVPDFDPPRYPDALRKVKNKRTSSSKVDDQVATWVASHLCHNRLCCNTEHLVWEPSWMNRLRDNCPGGEACIHGPDQCLRPHRPSPEERVDWTNYLEEGEVARYWESRLLADNV